MLRRLPTGHDTSKSQRSWGAKGHDHPSREAGFDATPPRMRQLHSIIPSGMNRALSGSRVPDDGRAIVAARKASTRDPSGRRSSIRTSAPCRRVALPPAQPDKTCSSGRRRGSRPGMPSGQRSAQPPTRSHTPRDEMPDRNAHARLPHEDVCRPTFPPPHPFLGAPQRRRRDGVQRWSYLSWCRHQTPFSSRPRGARSSHGYMPQSASSPRA